MSYEDGMPAGGNNRFRGYPARMSERQQLALLLQMTSQEMLSGTNRTDNTNAQSTSRSSPLQHQRGSKNRWSNKNGETPVSTAVNRKDDRVRQMLVNGYDPNLKDSNEIAGANSPDEATTPTAPESPAAGSPSDTAATAPPNDQEHQQHAQHYHHYQQHQAGSTSAASPSLTEDSGAPCEMRRTLPQNKVDRSGTGQTGSSTRVTLRLTQVRGGRDEKKGGGGSNSRQSAMSSQNTSAMETSKASSTSSSVGGSGASTTNIANVGSNSSSGDNSDVYEFKSSKEATPVRGSSSSPNPNPEKEKDAAPKSSSGQGQGSGPSSSAATSSATGDNASTSLDDSMVVASPSSKRIFEGDSTDDQDEETRKKKRKDTENMKDNLKGTASGRLSTGRTNANTADKCVKSGKQSSNNASGKGGQNISSITSDRKSPSSSTANSPKPSSTSAAGNKTAPQSAAESDGEDDRSKSSDSNSAPKVPPLKIVIPQSTTSEQEQGNRNGKNISNRTHQLPYVVASSNSNDSVDKEQSQSASGTTSPTDGTALKVEDKKDFSGALHGEERSTHHQRVLRSSHRSGNGGNGNTAAKDNSGNSSGNGNYSNSSPLPATSTTDRSNNSSPQQRHQSPVPETSSAEAGKAGTSDSINSSTGAKSSSTTEKFDKNVEVTIKKENCETSESSLSSSSTSTTNVLPSTSSAELHPRKRKLKSNKEAQMASSSTSDSMEATSTGPEVHPHDQPITNCVQLFLNIRKQIERKRKGLFPVQPKPPQGFKDYLMNRGTYVLAGTAKEPNFTAPPELPASLTDLYISQEKDRHKLRMQHVVEKEKLVLSVEQEILRVHGRAARALANQSLPFSACTILKDEEVYNVITPEQEEKDRNARSRYNGRLFLSWLQDVDDKWEKIKEAMLLRHHNEAESMHAVQRMEWSWKLREVGLCEYNTQPKPEDMQHVPMVHVSDDFDLLPA